MAVLFFTKATNKSLYCGTKIILLSFLCVLCSTVDAQPQYIVNSGRGLKEENFWEALLRVSMLSSPPEVLDSTLGEVYALFNTGVSRRSESNNWQA